VQKIGQLSDLTIEWHFIGPVQSNKTRALAENFAWVHSVDREKIAERLSAARPPELPPLNVCLQVNVSGEATKGGVAPADVCALARAVARLPHMRLRGLMTLPQPEHDQEAQRKWFRMLREIRDRVAAEGIALDTLSMGMSDDLEAAILEGATIVRVGTAVFGPRR
jgi:pyridoxal phosphate enzyme (YggS family)